MNLPDREKLVTPIDDPCQFSPDWRSIVSGYLFSVGVRTEEDLRSVALTGCSVVFSGSGKEDDVVESLAKGGRKSKKGKKSKKEKKPKNAQKKTLVPVEPFYEHPEYRIFANDKWIVNHVLFCQEQIEAPYMSNKYAPFKLAGRWYEEEESEAAMKKRIEALLLTEVGMDVITMDLVGQPSAQPAIEAYERMYFNCRDDNFNVNPSIQLVTRMAMPFGPLKMYLKKWEEIDPKDGKCVQDGRPIAKDSDIWKAIGATMGYDTLIYVWNWERRASGIKDKSLKHKLECTWHSAVSRIMTSLFTGDMKHEDAARVLATCTAQLKFIDDSTSGKGGAGSNELFGATLSLLEIFSPRMVSVADKKRIESRNSEIESRIQSQMAISSQTIEDKGEKVSEDIVDAQISNALNME